MVCSCREKPRGRQSYWCATHGLPPVEKAPNWKGKLLIFTVRCSSRSLRWRISPVSKPNSCLSLKFTQIHKGKKTLIATDCAAWSLQRLPLLAAFLIEVPGTACCYLGFLLFWGQGKAAEECFFPRPSFWCGPGLHGRHGSHSGWDHRSAVHGGQPGLQTWPPPNRDYCGQAPAVPKLTCSPVGRQFQRNAAPHRNRILFPRRGRWLYVLQELFCAKAENWRSDGRNGTETLTHSTGGAQG